MTVTGGSFLDNSASQNGAGIDGIGFLSVSGATFQGNVAVSNGGALHTYGGFDGFPGSMMIADCTIQANSASYGGGVADEVAPLTITGTTIESNSAFQGGGVYSNFSSAIITGTTIESNSGTSSGGGLDSSSSTISIEGSIFNGNMSGFGGGIYSYYDNATTITDSSFEDNSASFGSGGGLYNYGTTVTITGTGFEGNLASSGGGLFNNFGTPTVTDSTFEDNTATFSGGGLYNGYGSVNITDSILEANQALNGSGGGISNGGTLKITGSTLEDNTATFGSGGGLFNDYYSSSTIDGDTFTDNSAGSLGGGLADTYGSATITNNTFSGNSAPGGGGISYLGSYFFTVANNVITANSSIGILIQGSNVSLQANTITDNTGDGVRIDGGFNNTIGYPGSGNTITGNTGAGVAVVGSASSNAIHGNVNNSNAGLAIDLGDDGRTANDLGDSDSGPNTLQNYPVITTVDVGATTHVVGKLNSTPNTTFTIDFYADSAVVPFNPGESFLYLDAISVTTDSLGNASFDVTLTEATSPGEIVTATATDPAGNTSEFSDLSLIQVTPTFGLFTSESGTKATFSVVLTSQPTANVTIPLSSSDTTEGTVSPASLTFTPANWNVPKVVTVTGKDDTIADGPIVYTIITSPAISTDPRFSGMDADDVQVTNFDNDFPSKQAIQPSGSLIYDASLEGRVGSATGKENYLLYIDPGQKVTVVVDPEGTDLQPTIQLFPSTSSLPIGTATATAPGQQAVLQTVATQGQLGGTGSPAYYQIRVTGAAGTTGLFTIRVILNAAVENESHDGASNDTRATAQSLEPSFLSLNSAVAAAPTGVNPARGAVLGRTDSATPDYYSFSLTAGQTATLALTGLSSGDLTLALENSAGTTLALGRTGETSQEQVINSFLATTAGTYYVRLTGTDPDGTDYSLVVTRNAEFDTEPNDSIATAQDIVGPEVAGRRWAVGSVSEGGDLLGLRGTPVSGPLILSSDKITIGINPDGSYIVGLTGIQFLGNEFVVPGTPLAGFTIGEDGANFTNEGANGTTEIIVSEEDLSSGSFHGVRIVGMVGGDLELKQYGEGAAAPAARLVVLLAQQVHRRGQGPGIVMDRRAEGGVGPGRFGPSRPDVQGKARLGDGLSHGAALIAHADETDLHFRPLLQAAVKTRRTIAPVPGS